MPPPNQDKKYIYSDYLTWPDNERWEIINGIPYMQAAPTWQHQALVREILTQFSTYLKDKPCQVFALPFDIRLPVANENDEDTTFVVHPDIVVVCEKSGLKGLGYFGIPSLVIEITSPATVRNDKLWKFNSYEKAGVKEYWVVEPEGKLISVFTLLENKLYGRPEIYTETDKIKISVFPDFLVDLEPVFMAID